MSALRPLSLTLLVLWPLAAAAQGPISRAPPGVPQERGPYLGTAARPEQPLPRAEPSLAAPVEKAAPPGALTPQPLDGAAVPAWSLADVEELARANHPSLAAASARVEAAHGAWLQAGLGPNPELGYTASEVGNEGRAGQQGGFVSQEFVTGGKLRLSREVAARDIALAEQRLAAQRLRVAADVRIAFYDALVSQRRAQVATDLVRI